MDRIIENTIHELQLSRERTASRFFAYYGKIAAAKTSVEFSDITAGVRTHPENDLNKNADYAIRVNGNSMDPDFYSCFHIQEDSRHFLYTDKMEFQVMELPKLPKELREDSSDIELWGKFINAERKEEFAMIAAQNKYIGSAYKHLQMISQDDEKRMEYEARAKAIRDYNQGMLEAEQRGEARINKLNTLLIQDNRFNDLERSVNDISFQKQLMAEYGL